MVVTGGAIEWSEKAKDGWFWLASWIPKSPIVAIRRGKCPGDRDHRLDAVDMVAILLDMDSSRA